MSLRLPALPLRHRHPAGARAGTRLPSAAALAAGNPWLEAAVRRSRKLVTRRALAAGVAGALPLPGLDWMVDAALLTQLLPRISAEFGLGASQVHQMRAQEQEQVRKAAAMVGSLIVGRVVTQAMVLRLAKVAGVRLTTAQAAKYIPLGGQIAAGVIGYGALRLIAEQHIRDCVRVARATLPAPADPAQNTAL